ncbi:hypothetical protein ACLMJK_002415 [Lecanora helva]
MSPPLPKYQPPRTLIDLYNEKDSTPWYWRTAATLSAFLIVLGFLIFAPATQSTSSTSNKIAAIVILALGYILSFIVAVVCKSWVFRLDILYIPCLSSSLLGLINVLYTLSLRNASLKWTSLAIAGVTLSAVFSLLYTIVALLTFRKIYIVRARDAMHRHQPESGGDGILPETELQRQQLLRLLLQQEDAKKSNADNQQQTFKLEWPGNGDNRRNTMSTLRNLPRVARAAYEHRNSVSNVAQDPHPQAQMHMDPVTEEESLDPRMGPVSHGAYMTPANYDDENIPGIVNTRYPSPTSTQTDANPVRPPLQANGYPIEKPEAQGMEAPQRAERNMNQYHVVDDDEWRRQIDEGSWPRVSSSRESRRIEIELADRGRGRNGGTAESEHWRR